MTEKKKILLLTTGGTIASIPGGEGLEPHRSDVMERELNQLRTYYDITVQDVMCLDSSNIRPEEWKLIATRVFENRQSYDGKKPVFISEYGGIKWTPDMFTNENSDRRKAWGYGNAVKSLEEFVDRFCRQTAAIMATPNVMGLCYTQLTDVEQEQNGLYTYDRRPKFDPATIHAIFSRKAAIED